jgi:type I restriction enzyme S subunit
MEVKQGYKKTEVGIIPYDWEVVTVGSVGMTEGGFAFNSKRFVESGTYQVIKMSNLYGGNLSLDRSHSFLNQIDEEEKHFLLKGNDIIITITGTVGKRDYGYSYFIKDEKNLLLNQRVARILVNERCDPHLLFYQTKMPCFLNQFFDSAKGGTGNQANVATNDLDKVRIPIPPTKAEQTAIATALSDADKLISTLEKLIAKKRNIKKGAMQQLLQPKEGWTTKTIGEIGVLTGAGVDKKINEGEIPVRLLNYMDVFNRDFIYSDELNHWVTASTSKLNQCSVLKGDIFFTPSSEMRYDIAISAVAMEDIPQATYSYHLYRLRLIEDWDIYFRNYIFKTRHFLGQAETLCEGSGKRYVISLSKFRGMNICYPASKDVQSGISKVLSDMDAEITALETKLEKYKQIKQGMMQNLLTGRIRLV